MSSDSPSSKPKDESTDFDDFENEYAEAFDAQTDPLGQYSDTFQDLPDPFTYFIVNVLHSRDSIDDPETFDHYRRTYR